MKKLINLIIVLSAIFVFLFCVDVFASGTQLVVSNTSCEAGDEVTLEISMPANTGLVSMLLSLDYDDSVLTLKEVVDEGTLAGANHSDKLNAPYTLSWENDESKENITATGKLVTLKFKVEYAAEIKDYPVTITAWEILDKDINDVETIVTNGSINVTSKKPAFLEVENLHKDNDNITLDVNLLSTTEITGTIIATVYREDGYMLEIKPYPAEEIVNIALDSVDGKYVKIMWWDTDTATPLAKFFKSNIN